MATSYHFSTLLGIRRLLPRRPWISDTVFQNIKTLGIFKPLRAKKKTLQNGYYGHGNRIPVRMTDRNSGVGEKPRTILTTRGEGNSTRTSNQTILTKMKSIHYGNLIPVAKVSEQPVVSCGLINCQSVRTKPHAICDLITEHKLTCLALTETWLSPSEDNNTAVLASLMPEDYSILHLPRKTRGGGVGFIYNNRFSPKLDLSLKFTSFECQTVLMDVTSFTYRFILCTECHHLLKTKFKRVRL
jgi:hypothetical protein